MGKCTERFEDMSQRGRLRLWQQDDGDIVVQIIPDPETDNPGCAVEFCTSGGKSHRTLAALRELMAAMHADNCDPLLSGSRGEFHENMPVIEGQTR